MTDESALREKLTRIWSQTRDRYVLVRIRYESLGISCTPNVIRLHPIEEIEDGY